MDSIKLRSIVEQHEKWLCSYGRDGNCADLRGANLMNADLRGADLKEANLKEANLRGADLMHANLMNSDLRGANLMNADLREATNIPFIPMSCPEEGSFIGFKKASNNIVKLLIPKDARRSSATSRKCRCDKAIVVEIQNPDGTVSDKKSVASDFDPDFVYTIGETVFVRQFNENRFDECSSGIHFFINRQDAVEYFY